MLASSRARLGKTGSMMGTGRCPLSSSGSLVLPRVHSGRRRISAAAGDSSADQLRDENERLRQALASRLDAMKPEERSALIEQHNRLRESAQAAGVEIPSLATQAEARAAAVSTRTVDKPAAPGSQQESTRVAVETGASGELVFRFDSLASASVAAGSVQNAATSTAMATGKPATAGGGGGGKPGDVPATLTFGAPVTATAGAAASAPPSQAGTSGAAPSRAPAAAGPDYKALQAAANQEVAQHDPKALAKGREGWLYFTVPEKPVAGADCVIYFNRWQSEPLRHSGRLQLHAKYNTWEIVAPEGDRVDMPHEGRINRAEGTDYYSARVRIPEEAFEINFVLSNGDGVFDNNGTQNYLVPVQGPMTRDLWIETAPERAEAAWREKKAEEERKAEEAAAAEAAAKAAEDERLALEAVAELKKEAANWQAGAVKQEAGRWRMVPQAVQPGGRVSIQYNRLGGPFAGFNVPADAHLTLRIGHNSWKAPQDLKMVRSKVAKPVAAAAAAADVASGDAAPADTAPAPEAPAAATPSAADPGGVATTPEAAAAPAATEANEEWWEAAVAVPEDATVLNFVVNYYEHFDNNGSKDFKALVDLPSKLTLDAWADSLRESIKAAVTRRRLEQEAATAAVEAERLARRRKAQAKAEAVRRKQMKHVLFTVPEVPEAGKDVTVFYNPNNGGLPGREKLWIKGGWNRWRHPKAFGPLEMTPPKEGDHFSVTLTAPKDAYCVDFVFTDAVEYGQYDSNNGLDFHIPVKGSVVEEPPLHVVHVAVEMAPICKVGGLGDVVTSLGRAVQDQGHQVEVILPRYDFFQQSPLLGGTQYETEFDFGGTRVFVSTCVVEGLRCFFIEPRNGMFSGVVYQGSSDAGRFDFFSRAALEFLLRTGRQPDILHCHDWSSADVAKAYWSEYNQYGLWKPNVIFTIHNMDFGQVKLGEAAYYSQRFTTVSPSYAWEIGDHPAIAPNVGKLRGVRNGIDIDIWDPETDIFLPRGYTADSVVEGKAAARAELRKRLNLTSWGDKPLVGVVSRLTKQKGTHLIAHSIWRTIDRGGQFVLLGSAPDPKIQAEFDELKNQHGGDTAAFCFAFDEPLSHLIYAACDIILVPSMFEPCGLTQMIAMRYGAIPVVRATGGLKDTIFDVDSDKARAAWEMEGSTDWLADGVDQTNGFSFEGTDAGALDYALNRAFDAYYNDRQWFHSLQKRVMEQDWSWNKPAHDYIELYYAASK